MDDSINDDDLVCGFAVGILGHQVQSMSPA